MHSGKIRRERRAIRIRNARRAELESLLNTPNLPGTKPSKVRVVGEIFTLREWKNGSGKVIQCTESNTISDATLIAKVAREHGFHIVNPEAFDHL